MIGLDVHVDSITAAILEGGREKPDVVLPTVVIRDDGRWRKPSSGVYRPRNRPLGGGRGLQRDDFYLTLDMGSRQSGK